MESTTPTSNELQEAISSAKNDPSREDVWDRIEDMAAASQGHEEVAAAYCSVMREDLDANLADTIGQRAMHWHEEWLGEDSPGMLEVLERVLELSPASQWAFQRLTVLHTARGRWDELLSVYDRAIESAADRTEKAALLDEAANLAKDFARDTNATIRYMQQRYELDRKDDRRAAQLEKQLEKQERWDDLNALWRDRINIVPKEDGWKLRARIATVLYEKSSRAGDSIVEARRLLEEGAESEELLRLLERIAQDEETGIDERKEALELLKSRYEAANRNSDLVRTLNTAIAISGEGDSAKLHREAADRMIAEEDFEGAMDHLMSVVKSDAGARDALDKLRSLAKKTSNYSKLADALEEAAKISTDAAARVELRSEAGDVRRTKLNDVDGAVSMYRAAMEEEQVPVISVMRRLAALLGESNRLQEQLDVLERLSQEEPEPADRKAVSGQVARLAEDVGQVDRALTAWQFRLSIDGGDSEALDSMINLLEKDSRWADLVEALKRRADANVPVLQKRADLVRAASVLVEQLDDHDGGIEIWEGIAEKFGETPDTVDALGGLYTQRERWEDVSSLLARAAEREAKHVAQVLNEAGDVHRSQLDSPSGALERYARALAIDPGDSRARAGLTELLEIDDCRAGAARALGEAYRLTDDWEGVVGLTDARVAGATDSAEKVHVLSEAARLVEDRGGDASGALDLWARAMPLSPEDPSLELQVMRLAESTERWDTALEAIRGSLENLSEESARAQALLLQEARILDRHLVRPADAVASYGRVLDAHPDRGVVAASLVRAALKAGQWEQGAWATLIHSKASHALQNKLVTEIANAAGESGAWNALTEAFEKLVPELNLSGRLARDVEMLCATWHAEHRGDSAAAEAAFTRALAHDNMFADALEGLARIQRNRPGRALYDTLTRLHALDGANLDSLQEAAEVTLSFLDETQTSHDTLWQLYQKGANMWKAGSTTTGNKSAESVTHWALERLAARYEADGDHARLITLCTDAAQLPGDKSLRLEWLRRAASTASLSGDRDRAVVMYRSVLDEDPADLDAMNALARLCEADGRLPEMLTLRKRELKLTHNPERKLELRLDIARIVGEIERHGGRLEALLDNLEDAPGHAATIDALVAVLESTGRYEALADHLEKQTRFLEQDGRNQESAKLWSKVAQLAEARLSDPDRAINAHRRVVELFATPSSLDALARLRTERGDHAAAAQWLERRFASADPAERTGISVRLARAHFAAGQESRAITCLEQALGENPESHEVRRLLADAYRRDEKWEALARVLTSSAQYLTDRDELLDNAREAARIYREHGMLDRGIPVLEKAAEAAPGDREIRLLLADGLHVAGFHDASRKILEQTIEEFGRRRTAERAQIHLLLARVEHAAGNIDEALEQLETASGMDMSNSEILQLLGDISIEKGDLPRAERAYRALLLVVRRQASEDVDAIGSAEVQYALHRIATGSGDDEQAKELLESAMDSAKQSDVESERLTRALLENDEGQLALEVLDARMEQAEDAGRILGLQGKVLWSSLGRGEEGFEKFLDAIKASPLDDDLHRQARILAVELDASRQYADAIRAAAGRADAVDRAPLLMRLGRVLEEDVQDLTDALSVYSDVESSGYLQPEAWQAKARVAAAAGNSEEQAKALENIVRATNGSIAPPLQTDAMFTLASIKLADVEFRDVGADLLSAALDRDPRYTQAANILQKVEVEENDSLMALYGRVARSSTDSNLLLDYLSKRADGSEAALSEIREAIDLAMSLEAFDRAEALLERAAEVAEESEGLSRHLWIPKQLAQRRMTAGDPEGALSWIQRAAESTEGGQAYQLWLEAAELAEQANASELASNIYARLMEDHAQDRRVWEPYLRVLRTAGDDELFTTVMDQVVDGLTEIGDKNAVRMERARFLLATDGRESDAADVLRQVLADEPGHEEAGALLADLFEKTGYDEDLVDLLNQQLDAARADADADRIKELTLRLGGVLAGVRREDAMDVYRRAFVVLPEDRDIATALLGLFPDDHDPRDRAEVKERLLATEEGEAASLLALELADQYHGMDDVAGVQRSLERGYRNHSESAEVRERLEALYLSNEDWGPYAAYLAAEAHRVEDTAEQLELFVRSATLYREQMGDPAEAANVLSQAQELAPENTDILAMLVAARVDAGAHEEAALAVSEALERDDLSEQARAELLRARGKVRMALGQHVDAIADFEGAYARAGAAMGANLTEALYQVAQYAAEQGDDETQRNASLRYAQVLSELGEVEQAREMLHAWVDASPHDRDAVLMLCAIDDAAEDWDALIASCGRLVGISEGEDKVEAVIRMADACSKAGRPEDARAAMEETLESNPENAIVREHLKQLYEHMGAHGDLARMLMADVAVEEDEDRRHELLSRAGAMFVSAGEADAGIPPLEEAVRLKPTDTNTVIILVDALMAAEKDPEAGGILEQAIEAHPRRRSPELALMQHRMSMLAQKAGDPHLQMQWLNAAMESDKSNGDITAALAYLAIELKEHDVALNALRVVTLNKAEGPMSRAMAFLLQAQIAHEKGESRRALLWARKAKSEDPELAEADEFLAQLGA